MMPARAAAAAGGPMGGGPPLLLRESPRSMISDGMAAVFPELGPRPSTAAVAAAAEVPGAAERRLRLQQGTGERAVAAVGQGSRAHAALAGAGGCRA